MYLKALSKRSVAKPFVYSRSPVQRARVRARACVCVCVWIKHEVTMQFKRNRRHLCVWGFFCDTTLSEHAGAICDCGHLEEDLSPRVRNGSRLAELWDSARKEGWDMTVIKLKFTRLFVCLFVCLFVWSAWFTVHTMAVAEAAVWVGHSN